jgi:hypothetical protein
MMTMLAVVGLRGALLMVPLSLAGLAVLAGMVLVASATFPVTRQVRALLGPTVDPIERSRFMRTVVLTGVFRPRRSRESLVAGAGPAPSARHDRMLRIFSTWNVVGIGALVFGVLLFVIAIVTS